MMPTVLMLKPSVVTLTAKVRMAPITSRKMLAPMLIVPPSRQARCLRVRPTRSGPWETPDPDRGTLSAGAVAGPELGVVDGQPDRPGDLELEDEPGEQADPGEGQQLPLAVVEQLQDQAGEGREQAEHQGLAGPAHCQAAEADGPGPLGPGPAQARVGVVEGALARHQQPGRPPGPPGPAPPGQPGAGVPVSGRAGAAGPPTPLRPALTIPATTIPASRNATRTVRTIGSGSGPWSWPDGSCGRGPPGAGGCQPPHNGPA